MKISSASKKVLASALSAAMVVAFAPTVAFATNLGTETDNGAAVTGDAIAQVQWKDGSADKVTKFSNDGDGIQEAFDFAATKTGTVTVKLLADATVKSAVTLDLNGHTWSNKAQNLQGGSVDANAAYNSLDQGPIVIGSQAAGTKYKLGLIPATAGNVDSGNLALTVNPDQTVTADVAIDTKPADTATIPTLESGKTYEVDGVIYKAAAFNATSGTYYVISKTAQKVAATAGALTIKGGTFTTGAADVKTAASSTLKVIEGTVSSMENATVEGIGGTYTGADNATLGNRVEGVTVSGAVKKSSVKVTGADYSQAVALTAGGAVEETTAEATAGAADKTNKSYATAVKANNTAAATYKKVTATAVANGSSEATKDGSDTAGTPVAISATGSAAVTINSGSFTGERAKSSSASIVLKGGQYSQHISASDVASVPSGFATVCLGEGKTDWVYTKAAADYYVNGVKVVSGEASYNSAVVAAANAAFDNAAAAAISGSNPYEVGYAMATGYDAAKLAATVTDADEAAKLSQDVRVYSGQGAVAVKAPKKLTAEQEAFNAGVAAVDKAAADASKVGFTYANVSAGETYKASAAAESVDVLSLSDLGKVKDNGTSVNHGDTAYSTKANAIDVSGLVVASGYIINGAKGLTTATKSPATVIAADGSEIAGKANDAGTAYVYKTTKLGAFGTVAANGQSAVDKPDTPAGDKATQGIDVAKKSKTVKLAKKATKTKKAASFNMGVSAETAVTTAKKSGSSKITVKGGKVTLKKGVKKGTYTAKVTVKAAASDQYLAATKTVTVKFVVKK